MSFLPLEGVFLRFLVASFFFFFLSNTQAAREEVKVCWYGTSMCDKIHQRYSTLR